jgi:hypothetical protein
MRTPPRNERVAANIVKFRRHFHETPDLRLREFKRFSLMSSAHGDLSLFPNISVDRRTKGK